MSKNLSVAVIFLLAVGLYFCFFNQSYAMEITLKWDANTEQDLAGYYIYYKTDPNQDYVAIIDLFKAEEIYSNANFVIAIYSDANDAVICKFVPPAPFGPGMAKTYFFVVTAYDTSGLESYYSNEVKAILILEEEGDINSNKEFYIGEGYGCFMNTIRRGFIFNNCIRLMSKKKFKNDIINKL